MNKFTKHEQYNYKTLKKHLKLSIKSREGHSIISNLIDNKWIRLPLFGSVLSKLIKVKLEDTHLLKEHIVIWCLNNKRSLLVVSEDITDPMLILSDKELLTSLYGINSKGILIYNQPTLYNHQGSPVCLSDSGYIKLNTRMPSIPVSYIKAALKAHKSQSL